MRVPVTTIAFELLGFAGWPVAVVICPVTQLPFVDTVPGGHGTFADAERALPRLADMGFDVVYLPPIHPVGLTKRKGRNNTPNAAS